MPKVSICIPTHNGASYLHECLESAASQSYEDLEIIVVDDWSSDGTWKILVDYASKDSRVRLFRNDLNIGLVDNWNRCVDLAKGEWIKFVFQDDVLRSNCVELMLKSAGLPLVFCRRDFLFEEGVDAALLKFYGSLPTVDALVKTAGAIAPEQLQEAILKEPRNFFGEPTAALLHRSLFESFGLFNKDLRQLCDLEFWTRVAINTGLVYVNTPLASFRVHKRSTSANNRDPVRAERVNVFDQLVMLHEFAYNPHFAPLRRIGRSARRARRFDQELARRASWVKSRGKALANAEPTPDYSWDFEWQRLLDRYPNIERSTSHLPYIARHWFDKHVRWRFRTR